jgi:hypothetical protein
MSRGDLEKFINWRWAKEVEMYLIWEEKKDVS